MWLTAAGSDVPQCAQAQDLNIRLPEFSFMLEIVRIADP